MYPNRKEYLLIQPENYRINSLSGKVPTWFAWILAVLLLLFFGITYRVLASMMVNTVISLPVPLSDFPKSIDNWKGTEQSIPTTTREYMEKNFADDYLSRRYVNNDSQDWADVYVVYCASRPGGMLGHEPRVCYPGNGWVHDTTDLSSFTTKQGRKVDCLIHRFHKPAPEYVEIIILNFYIVNGHLSTNQRGFSGFYGRKFNLARNPARYVAQVQISSTMENSIRMAAKDMTELILDFLPDENGSVSAFEKYGHY